MSPFLLTVFVSYRVLETIPTAINLAFPVKALVSSTVPVHEFELPMDEGNGPAGVSRADDVCISRQRYDLEEGRHGRIGGLVLFWAIRSIRDYRRTGRSALPQAESGGRCRVTFVSWAHGYDVWEFGSDGVPSSWIDWDFGKVVIRLK